MPSFREALVVGVLSTRPGLARVRLADGARAYALTDLTGPVADGDRVVVNTTAVELGLGTGGWHVVHWNLSRGPWRAPGPGHILKLRYTSLQADVGSGEEEHPDIPSGLDGMPVVVGSLHSQLPGIAVALKHLRPDLRVVYVMTDGGALPLAFSDLVFRLVELGQLDGTVTAGHAFGGEVEAVNVPSALALARHVLAADVIVVAMGPGSVGTGTRLGTSALEVAPALDAAAWLGGRPIACVRISQADARARHRGVSHHTLTALDAVRSEVDVAVPAGGTLDLGGRHRVHQVVAPDVAGLLAALGLPVTTMGRTPAEEPAFFAACGAAAALAVALLPARPPTTDGNVE
ncbi:MAG: hypothetical protein JWN46_1638 [Acidimicrobiales bacterium]|nr:hypothetical protein [Acidimicrobiales bacterium]